VGVGATAPARYVSLREFLDFVFATRPLEGGGPRYDNGMDPEWNDATLREHEGARASYTDYVFVNADDKAARFRKLTFDEAHAERAFADWIEQRKERLDATLRVMGCLAFPSSEDEKKVGQAQKQLDALWRFLVVHAWPVYVRHARNAESIPFASVQRFYPLWFRNAHYDEYDRWAHGKWHPVEGERNGTPKERASQSPDLYTLMKRRYRSAVEADECYEVKERLSETEERHDFILFQTAVMEGTGNTVEHVHRPRSGGKSYGGGSFRTLQHDPYYTCGRERGMPMIETLPEERIAPAERFIDWSAVPSNVACTPDWRDAHPEPWYPAVTQEYKNEDLDDLEDIMGDLGDAFAARCGRLGGLDAQPEDGRMVRI